MTRRSGLEAFVERAFAKATRLCNARFGDLVAEVLVDDRARPQGFERALLQTDAPANVRFAIVCGDDADFRRIVPDAADEFHLLSRPELFAYWRPAPERAFFVFDRALRCGVTWFQDQVPPVWAIGHPCSPLIPAAIEETDWVLAHAGAVGRGGRFLLLVGPKKAGKSTATLACVGAGWDYAGDDLVLVDPVRGLVAPLYSSARLRQSGVAEFKSLADGAFMVSEEEGAPRYELRLPIAPTGGDVAAILRIRRRGAAHFSFEPARAADYMVSLLGESVTRAPGSAARVTPKLLAVGRMAPAFTVDTGMDAAAIPDGLDAILETIEWKRQRTA